MVLYCWPDDGHLNLSDLQPSCNTKLAVCGSYLCQCTWLIGDTLYLVHSWSLNCLPRGCPEERRKVLFYFQSNQVTRPDLLKHLKEKHNKPDLIGSVRIMLRLVTSLVALGRIVGLLHESSQICTVWITTIHR